MAIILRISLLLCLFVSQINLAYTQKSNKEAGEYKLLKCNVLALFGKQLQFNYEFNTSQSLSYQFTAGILGGRRSFDQIQDSITKKTSTLSTKQSGILLIPEVRYFPKQNAPSKLYFAGYLRFRISSEKQTDNSAILFPGLSDVSRTQKLTSFGFGLSLGYQIVREKVVFDFFVGPLINQLKTVNSYKNVGTTNTEFEKRYPEYYAFDKNGIRLRGGFLIGIVL